MTESARMTIALAPGGHGAALARRWAVPALVGVGAFAVCIRQAQALLNDGDTMMHIAVGRWIMAHHALPVHDPFSFTAHGSLWVPHEWLSEVIFATAYGWLGWGGVVATAGLAIAAAFALLTRALEPTLGPRRAAIAAVLALLLSIAHFLARPHVLAWPLMVVWMAGIIQARDRDRVPSFWLLPVMVVWCNLHGGFIVGLAMAGLLAIEAAATSPAGSRLHAMRGWAGFIGLAALAGLLSPNGINLYLLPVKMLRMTFAVTNISEWQGAHFSGFNPLELWIALVALGGFGLGLRLPWSRLLMVLLLLYEALIHVRNQELLGIVVPLLVAAPLARQLAPAKPQFAGPAAAGQLRPTDGLPAALAAAVVMLGFVATAVALDRRGLEPPGAAAPTAAVAAARAAGVTGHVLNSYRVGGYLIFVGIPVFIDGRADLYGDAFIKRFAQALEGVGDGLPALIKEYAIDWAILDPNSPAETILDHLPAWRQIYADKYAVVFRRAVGRKADEAAGAPPDRRP